MTAASTHASLRDGPRRRLSRITFGSSRLPVATAGLDEVAAPRIDRLRPFQRLIVGVRWGALLFSAILLTTTPQNRTTYNAVAFAVLAAWTALRTVLPVRHWGYEIGTAASVVLELGLAIAVVCLTGYWDSPLAFMLLPGVVIGGFSQGGPLVVGYGTVTGLFVAVSSAMAQHQQTNEQWQRSAQWTIELMVIALVAGVGHKVLVDTLARHSDDLDTMNRLTTANSLLFSLHKVAQSLPASLDLDDVVLSTIANARDLFENEGITILLRDDRLTSWTVARAEGLRLGGQLDGEQVPAAIEMASRSASPVRLADLSAELRHGLLPDSGSGLYVPLRARNTLVGVLVIEHTRPGLDTEAAAELAKRFAEPAAVAIDNARWFGRIRTVSADEERIRIARDLHDRIGQSLAYIGFELDRVAKTTTDEGTADELARLRGSVRNVVSEVRETLYDIRTDVTGDDGIVPTLTAFLDRVRQRTTMDVDFEHAGSQPLPARQEREMWQIAQEAIVNVERHSMAAHLVVRWQSDGTSAVLEVVDDGRGFSSNAGRTDSYGMRGLRERANAIGARLEITGTPGQGTTVRCRLDTP